MKPIARLLYVIAAVALSATCGLDITLGRYGRATYEAFVCVVFCYIAIRK